jgi:SAM-dependent methyltransferase
MNGATATTPVCRCCGSRDLAPHGRKPGAFIKREFQFQRCGECGFMTVEPFSGYEIYNDAYYRGEGPDPYVDYAAEYHNWRTSDRLLEFEDLVGIAGRYLGSNDENPGRLHWLDFGCGSGALLMYLRFRDTLRGRPLMLTGHDVGSYADLLKTKEGFRILNLQELEAEPDARFDVISMIEVLEHLPTPLETIRLVSRLLKPGGMLLLTTGNMDSPIARRQGINYRYCAPEIHVSLFTPRSLRRIYRRAGLLPHLVRYTGAVKFKVLKTLRHHRVQRAVAAAALKFPPVVRAVDSLYGVSGMPCAVKPYPDELEKQGIHIIYDP